MKKILFLLFFVIFVFSFGFSQTQENIKCGWTSEVILEWDDNVNLILSKLMSTIKDDEDNGEKSIKERIKWKIDKSLKKFAWYSTSLLYTSVLLIWEWLTSPFILIEVLFKPEEVVMDYKTILFLENNIRKYLRKIAIKWDYFEPIDVKSDLWKDIKNYLESKDNLLIVEFKGNISIKKWELIVLLYNLNFIYKTIIIYASFGRSYNDINNWYLSNICKKDNFVCDKIKFNLNEDKYQQLVSRYSLCKYKGLNLKNRIDNLVNTFEWDAINIFNRFRSWLERIDEALDKLKEESVPLSNRLQISSNITKDDIKKAFSGLDSKIVALKKLVGKKDISWETTNLKQAKEDYFSNTNKYKLSWENIWSIQKLYIKKELESVFDYIADLQSSMVLRNLQASPEVITKKYVVLSRYIYKNILLIGDKDTKNSIIKLLWDACEKQCSNVGGICWYF